MIEDMSTRVSEGEVARGRNFSATGEGESNGSLSRSASTPRLDSLHEEEEEHGILGQTDTQIEKQYAYNTHVCVHLTTAKRFWPQSRSLKH